MRLTGFEALDDMRAAAPRLREAVVPRVAFVWRRTTEIGAPWLERAGARLAPAQAWLAGQIAKSTALAAALAAITGTWATLVEAFCATIDPYLSRWFPRPAARRRHRPFGRARAHAHLEERRDRSSAPPRRSTRTPARRSRAPASPPIELRLRPDQVLQRSLTLPAASREFLASIIEHKLERLTPWRPERVLYGTRILDEGESGGSLTVELLATSKDIVAAPLQALGALGLTPTAIGIEDGPATMRPLRVNLLRDAPKAARVDSRRMVSRVALAGFAACGMVWLATSMWASSADDAAQLAGTRLGKARRLLKAATMGDVGERERALLEAKSPDRAVVVLVDKLARAIPADTYLKEMSIAPDKVRLVGVTTNAPALVGEIETTGLANVRFTSAVTREKDAKDSFEITADRAAPPAAETQ